MRFDDVAQLGSLRCRPNVIKNMMSWVPPSYGALKFNVDHVERGKPELAGIEGLLSNSNGGVLMMFSKYVGVKDSYEAKVLAILEVLRMFVRVHHTSSLWKVTRLMLFLGLSVLMGVLRSSISF